MASKLRATIENKIGRSILEKYCVIKEGSSGPIMIPPIPNSKYIDKLPENVVLKGANLTEKEHQRGYEAEVKVYRSFEEVKINCVVIHQIDYNILLFTIITSARGKRNKLGNLKENVTLSS